MIAFSQFDKSNLALQHCVHYMYQITKHVIHMTLTPNTSIQDHLLTMRGDSTPATTWEELLVVKYPFIPFILENMNNTVASLYESVMQSFYFHHARLMPATPVTADLYADAIACLKETLTSHLCAAYYEWAMLNVDQAVVRPNTDQAVVRPQVRGSNYVADDSPSSEEGGAEGEVTEASSPQDFEEDVEPRGELDDEDEDGMSTPSDDNNATVSPAPPRSQVSEGLGATRHAPPGTSKPASLTPPQGGKVTTPGTPSPQTPRAAASPSQDWPGRPAALTPPQGGKVTTPGTPSPQTPRATASPSQDWPGRPASLTPPQGGKVTTPGTPSPSQDWPGRPAALTPPQGGKVTTPGTPSPQTPRATASPAQDWPGKPAPRLPSLEPQPTPHAAQPSQHNTTFSMTATRPVMLMKVANSHQDVPTKPTLPPVARTPMVQPTLPPVARTPMVLLAEAMYR